MKTFKAIVFIWGLCSLVILVVFLLGFTLVAIGDIRRWCKLHKMDREREKRIDDLEKKHAPAPRVAYSDATLHFPFSNYFFREYFYGQSVVDKRGVVTTVGTKSIVARAIKQKPVKFKINKNGDYFPYN